MDHFINNALYTHLEKKTGGDKETVKEGRHTFPRDVNSSKYQIPAGGETKIPYTLRTESINGNNASRSSTTSSTTWSSPPWHTPLPYLHVLSKSAVSLRRWRKATSLLTCISADYLRLYIAPISIHIPRFCATMSPLIYLFKFDVCKLPFENFINFINK